MSLGFNINWPKYLSLLLFSLSFRVLVQSLHRRIAALAAAVNIEYTHARGLFCRRGGEEKTLHREREKQIFSKGYSSFVLFRSRKSARGVRVTLTHIRTTRGGIALKVRKNPIRPRRD